MKIEMKIDWKKFALYLGVFVMVFALSAYGAFKVLSEAFTVEVPTLTGRSLNEVEFMIRNMSLNLQIGGEVYDRDVPAGHVVEQSLEPGTKVKGMSTVEITLSKGVESRLIPELAGKEYSDVKQVLEEGGLYVSKLIKVNSSRVDEGVIIAQYPPAGVVSGEPMSLVVSTGPEDVTYFSPYFIGMAKMDALMLARDLGFSVRITELDRSNVISYQSPSPGAEINSGDVLRLRVGG